MELGGPQLPCRDRGVGQPLRSGHAGPARGLLGSDRRAPPLPRCTHPARCLRRGGPRRPHGCRLRSAQHADRAAPHGWKPPARQRRRAYTGKCLRGARRPDGSQVIVLSGVRHADAVLTVDALHAQRAHTTYLVVERGAHYLLTVKNSQPTLAAQLRALPWRDAPVLHRTTDRGHGREKVREVQVVTVDNLLFPPPSRHRGSAAAAAAAAWARRSGRTRPSTRSPAWPRSAISSAARSPWPAGLTSPADAVPTPAPPQPSPCTAPLDQTGYSRTAPGPCNTPVMNGSYFSLAPCLTVQA